ncbi:hypothetical protein Acr_25g0005790 [Actinidia rufa]|uniref:Uncharacterized protein n=1 Tax=Actinidia rufa TaxID=165716 RepID=A0A7J0GZ99_9ERIC|nr:hypothetical protein Acr_25g0005790 [Actinidia rufa]
MVRTKHASNGPRGDEPNPTDLKWYSNHSYTEQWRSKRLGFPSSRIVQLSRDESLRGAFPSNILALIDALEWNGLRPLPNDVYTNLDLLDEQRQHIDRLGIIMRSKAKPLIGSGISMRQYMSNIRINWLRLRRNWKAYGFILFLLHHTHWEMLHPILRVTRHLIDDPPKGEKI